jgi:glycosyltransferase involved in cell wall biosynthesis
VLREVPGTELLIYSYTKYPEYVDAWKHAIEGFPVRWVSDFLPVEEIASRLAAEADILVFWYRDGPLASASGAVRVGLATGVPVLASSIDDFSDLRGVTYQPSDLVAGVRRLLDDTELRDTLTAAARDYCRPDGWSTVAKRHIDLWREFEEPGTAELRCPSGLPLVQAADRHHTGCGSTPTDPAGRGF